MKSFKSRVKEYIYNSFPQTFKLFLSQEIISRHAYFKYLNLSFSQEGEDIILSQIFYGKTNGFYLDIGAHHPIKYSNTFRFYLNGWRGINIDAMPGSMSEFNKFRPEDINIEAAISDQNKELLYYIFDASGLNTLSLEHAVKMQKNGSILMDTVPVRTIKMHEVLRKCLVKGQYIDFLSLDVEGSELDVLNSNDWDIFRPQVILVESLNLENKKVLQRYFSKIQYDLIAQTVNNLYFKDTFL